MELLAVVGIMASKFRITGSKGNYEVAWNYR